LNIRKLIKTLLLIFVVLSFAVLIYKEFSPRNDYNATAITKSDTIAVTQGVAVSAVGGSVPATESRSLEADVKPQHPASSPQSAVKVGNPKVIVYYFHGTFRCTTCRTIEKYSHDAIQQYSSKELDNGTLEFRPLNVEEPKNRHFIQEYQLFSRSLVLSLVRAGKETKSKNLTDIWNLVSDKEKFYQYVKDEVEAFLREAQ
jgi:hypothetical protein